jgi:hypothetical protein
MMNASIATSFAARWNRTLDYWGSGRLTTLDVTSGSKDFIDFNSMTTSFSSLRQVDGDLNQKLTLAVNELQETQNAPYPGSWQFTLFINHHSCMCSSPNDNQQPKYL